MVWFSNVRIKSRIKALSLFVALIASIMLVFGGVYWVLGVTLLIVSLSTRFIMAIGPDITTSELQKVEDREKLEKIKSEVKKEEVISDVLAEAEKVYETYMAAQKHFAEAYKESKGKVELPKPLEEATRTRSKIRTLISHLPGETVTSYMMRPVNITVIGIGGGGCNFITNLAKKEISGIKLVAMNTDVEALKRTKSQVHVALGPRLTNGLGVNGDYDLGRRAAKESHNEVINVVRGSDIVIISLGMGGGTGTGAAPIIAEISKSIGALTIAIVTKPFTFEGKERAIIADRGITGLLGMVDTLVIIPNDKILEIVADSTKVEDAFRMVDESVIECVQAISEVVAVPGLINLDFLDLKAVLKDAGPAWMSIGVGSGRNRAIDAARVAIASPLMDVSLKGAKRVIFNVKGGSNLTLFEVNEAAEIIKEAVDPEANIIFGVTHDYKMGNKMKIILIATGFISKLGVMEEKQDEKTSLPIKGLEAMEMVDIPSFLRRPLYSTRRKQSRKGGSPKKEK